MFKLVGSRVFRMCFDVFFIWWGYNMVDMEEDLFFYLFFCVLNFVCLLDL